MRSIRIARHAATVAAVAGITVGATLPASAAPAAASSPGWRVVKAYGPTESAMSVNLTAASAADGWLTWIGWDGGAQNQVAHNGVAHWDGTAWQNVPVPANLEVYAQNTVAVAASSPRNAWLFNSFDPANGASFTKALRWNGSKWVLETLPSWVVRLNAAGDVMLSTLAFSITNMWVFSLGDTFGPHQSLTHFVARYDGRSWSRMTLPLIPDEVSASSPTDIWVMGDMRPSKTRSGARVLARWNGRKWTIVSEPKLTAPKGWVAGFGNIVALGPDNIWGVEGYSSLVNPVAPEPWNLQHWNGKSWVKIGFPFPTGGFGAIAPDGHGGLWVSDSSPKPGFKSRVFHLAGGHWTEFPLPGTKTAQFGLVALTWIPGTRSLWAWGEAANSTGPISAVILKYGP